MRSLAAANAAPTLIAENLSRVEGAGPEPRVALSTVLRGGERGVRGPEIACCVPPPGGKNDARLYQICATNALVQTVCWSMVGAVLPYAADRAGGARSLGVAEAAALAAVMISTAVGNPGVCAGGGGGGSSAPGTVQERQTPGGLPSCVDRMG